MSKISMYVMAHKKFDAPQNEIYKPMQVGAALHDDLGYIRDDSGDNISTKNPNYSELTGMYWAWKNDHDSDIVGICHYRRFFADENLDLMNGDYIESLLDKADVVTPYPARLKNTLFVDYCLAHNAADMVETKKAIQKLYPDYLDTFEEIMNGHLLFYANMMITRKSIFDEYCKWLFDILFEVEKNLDISGYNDYNKRVFGFVSERLLAVWIQKKKKRILKGYVIVSGDKAETTELINWGVERVNEGDYDKLIAKFDERRAQYSNLFREGSDSMGHLNILYEIAQHAIKEGSRTGVLGMVAEKYIARNYYLEYARCMLDMQKKLKPKTFILGSDEALYGVDLSVLQDSVPLAMPAQDLFYDQKFYEKAVEDGEQIKSCILVAEPGIMYKKSGNNVVGATITNMVYDVIFPEKGSDSEKKPWEFVPDGLLADSEKTVIEEMCRNIPLKRGGFFNDINPRGKNLNVADCKSLDVYMEKSETRETHKGNVIALETIARGCEERNIRFIIVVPPHKADVDNPVREKFCSEFLNILDELPYPVEYQDLNSEVWDGIFFDEDFYDDNLLNNSGAVKFTQILNELTMA